MSTYVDSLDTLFANFLSQWDLYTTVLALVVTGLVAHTIYTASEPDTHPFLLSRQTYAERVRQPGESPVHHSPDSPGGGMRSGLDIKLPGDKPYSAGRDGDLRHVWLAVSGAIKAPKVPERMGPAKNAVQETKRSIVTVLGQLVVEHEIDDLSREISVLGSYLQKHGTKRVAVYLPNSIELLTAVFGMYRSILKPLKGEIGERLWLTRQQLVHSTA
jgi:hypothetical protein